MTKATEKPQKTADKSEPKKSRGRPALGDEAREALIEAASAILREEGVAKLGARAVAKRAGVAVGTIYKYFDDLTELVRHANAETYDKLAAFQLDVVEKERARGGGVYEQLLALARGYIAFVEANEHEWNATLSFNAQAGEAPQWYRIREASLLEIVEGVLKPLPRLKSRDERLQLAMALWSSVHGIITITMRGGFQAAGAEEAMAQVAIVVKPVVEAYS